MRKIDSAVVVAKSQRPTVSMRSSSWTTDQSLSSWSWWTDTTNLSWFVRRRGNTKFYGGVRITPVYNVPTVSILILYGHPALDVFRYTVYTHPIFRISIFLSFDHFGRMDRRIIIIVIPGTRYELIVAVCIWKSVFKWYNYDEYVVCFILSGLARRDGDTFTRR